MAGNQTASSSKSVARATLTAFRSCGDALSALRSAAEASVTPSGLPNSGGAPLEGAATPNPAGAAGQRAPEAAAAAGGSAAGSAAPGYAPAATAPAFSGTNDYQPNVDEPDLVKTDGRRIVTVTAGTLEVIDAASRLVTGSLNLASARFPGGPANLLLSGDHALLLTSDEEMVSPDGPSAPVNGPRFLLIDLSGQPRIIASYTIQGSMVDARMTGSVARIVTASQPDISFPAPPPGASVAERVAADRAATGQAGLDAWLPHFESSGAGGTIAGRVPCTAVSRPASYSGTNLLTVLTFDLSATSFGTGDPVSVVADGDTVYGTTSSLYVASGEMRPSPGISEPGPGGTTVRQETQLYRFDISGPGAPRYVASGAVPGYLVDQYAMSEWNGYLRVATTTGTSWAPADGRPTGAQTSSSAVYVLTTSGPAMRIVGQVTGLGTMERIYAVRFMGPAGYVVTFRQTDPLYTLDLSDPAHPRVVGALGLTGYSAYLHPVSATRLIGIGQQADSMGHVLGMQLSLFDVSDLATPARLDSYALAESMSQAQSDPHAFLYWPADQLVVVPIQTDGPVAADPGVGTAPAAALPQSGALVLRIAGTRIVRTGFISQPEADPYTSPIERSLVIGQTLWTVSAAGLLASDLTSLREQAWLPFPA
ncbi:MAG TPA: beta-propeller domain-containing protein [Trebonia sp.]